MGGARGRLGDSPYIKANWSAPIRWLRGQSDVETNGAVRVYEQSASRPAIDNSFPFYLGACQALIPKLSAVWSLCGVPLTELVAVAEIVAVT